MADILLYWRDFKQDWVRQFAGEYAYFWHSNARILINLQAGDRLWLVTSGKNIGHEVQQTGFLVGIWQVREVITNPGDDPTYPKTDYRYRVVADPTASMTFEEPVLVDHILRPARRDKTVSIGRFLQGPRKLKDETIRLLKSAAGPQMAVNYLTGRQL